MSEIIRATSESNADRLLNIISTIFVSYTKEGFGLCVSVITTIISKLFFCNFDADDIALLANTPDQAEILLHSLELAAAGIGLPVNAHKTEYLCFNQRDNISTLNGSSLKLVDKFIYRGSSVSSTKTDFNTRLAKAWTAFDRLPVTWKSDLTDKIKSIFFQTVVVLILYGCTTLTPSKRREKSLTAMTQECCEQYGISPGGSTQQSSSCTSAYPPSWKLSNLDEPDMWDTGGEVGMNS